MSFIPPDPDPRENYVSVRQEIVENISDACSKAWRRLSDVMARLEKVHTQLGYAADGEETLAEMTGLAERLEAAIAATGRQV